MYRHVIFKNSIVFDFRFRKLKHNYKGNNFLINKGS